MATRSKYKTKQRETILHYLAAIPGAHFTAGDVCAHFKSSETPIGQSTVYRQLEQLVEEGFLNKYIIDANSPACFEYIGDDRCGEEIHFHCKCEKCGRLIHMHCEELEGIQAHLLDHHQFALNPLRTVFYGICEECGRGA